MYFQWIAIKYLITEMIRYRVFIKYCVFPENVVIFLNSASSDAVLVFDLPLRTHTDITRGETERGQSPA